MTIEQALLRFLEAYRRGLGEMVAQPPAWKSDVFDDRLRELLEARCDLLELLRVRSFLGSRRDGLVAARRSDLETSGLELQRAEGSLRDLKRPEIRLVCESLYCAALAYLCYRRAEPERAKQLIHRALAVDSELEGELGVGALYGHRFQLVHNLVHVEARFGDSESATRLGLELLEHLEGRPGAAPTSHRWSTSDHQKVPAELRRVLANQIVFELAALHLASTARCAENLRHQEHIRRCQAPQEILAVEAHAWLGFATGVEACGLVEAVDLATRYLEPGPRGAPALWYCGVLQCVERLTGSDSPAAQDAASAILRERAGWPLAPAVLRGPFPRAQRAAERPAEV
jgi:hypothetical protein